MFETRNPVAELRSSQLNWVLALTAIFSLAAVGIAVYLQVARDLYPCPLCILQRYAFLALAVAAVLGLAARRGWLRQLGAGLALAFALTGAAVAGRHVWLLLNPAEGCGRDRVAEFVNGLPMAQWAPLWFNASGSCLDEIGPVLGISFPVWALLLFAAALAALAYVIVRLARA
jgi:protein dithiol:quinone oxidoreductase